MLKCFLLLAVALQLSHFVIAQTPADTVLQLEEVVIYDIPEQKFATGSKIIRFDSAEMAQQQSRSLSDLLIRKTPVYFREYGAGMLSSVSFRGTSAGHTAVLWNGLNMNQPNLGQTDFSLIPLFATENIAVQFGGSSALYGSDAIGGSIYLSSTPQWQEQLLVKVQQEAGSFGRNFSGISVSAGLRNWSLTSKIYRLQADNDFKFENTQKRGRPIERNRNAAFEQKGIVQDIAYRFSGNSYLSFKSWYQQTERQIQAPMGNSTMDDRQDDRNLNLSLQYRNNGPAGFFDAQLGHLYNYQLYTAGGAASDYRTWQHIGNFRYEKSIGKLLHLRLGHKINYIQAAIAQYPENRVNEARNDLFASVRLWPSADFTASFNFRQAFVTGFAVPFTPSAGLEYTFIRKSASSFKWLASGGRSYRVPTLNDRYWEYSGNPNLIPENSWNTETGLHYDYSRQQKRIQVRLTGYSMWVDNWILWLPGLARNPEGNSLWAPVNVQEVHSKGLEAEGSFLHPLLSGTLEAGGTFAYTRSINKTAKTSYDRTVNKQLPFVPEIKYNTYLNYQLNTWSMQSNWSYVGRRYTTGEGISEYSLPAFYLLDVSVGKIFSLEQHSLNLLLEVRNLLDQQYQNYENRAMPGRNFNITAKYLFNHPIN